MVSQQPRQRIGRQAEALQTPRPCRTACRPAVAAHLAPGIGEEAQRPRRRDARHRAGAASPRRRCADWRRRGLPSASCRSFMAAKSAWSCRPRRAPRAPRARSPASRSGMSSMVRTLAVTSSPSSPSPRVAATTKPPVLVAQRARQPVDLRLGGEGEPASSAGRGSGARAPRTPPPPRRSKTLSSDSIGTRWRTLANFAEGVAPTLLRRAVGPHQRGKARLDRGVARRAARRIRRRRWSARPPGSSGGRARRSRAASRRSSAAPGAQSAGDSALRPAWVARASPFSSSPRLRAAGGARRAPRR